jgi:hypothetical protein
MDSNDIHRHKHRHMHTHHMVTLDVCLGNACLDVCLGTLKLRQILFSKKYKQHHSNHFLNKPWDQIPLNFPFLFLNKILRNFNHTLTSFCKITNSSSQFHNLMPLRPLSLILQNPIFKIKINQQKQKPFLEENYGGFDPLKGYVGKETIFLQFK